MIANLYKGTAMLAVASYELVLEIAPSKDIQSLVHPATLIYASPREGMEAKIGTRIKQEKERIVRECAGRRLEIQNFHAATVARYAPEL